MDLFPKKYHLWVGGSKVTVCVCLLKLGPYKKYGTSVTVHASHKKRRRAHLRVVIVNDYFQISDNGTDYVHIKRDELSSKAQHKTKLVYPHSEQNTDFSVAGIYSQCLVRFNGEEINGKLINGKVPTDFTSSLKPHF